MKKWLRWLGLAAMAIAGMLLCWWAVVRWNWYCGLPRMSSVRFCGNCFLAYVGVPLELGSVGLILIVRALLSPTCPWSRSEVPWWLLLIFGLLGTPGLISMPFFLVAYGALSLSTARAIGRW